MNTVINVGLMGFGSWPRRSYAPLLKELPGVRVVGVAAQSGATQQLARKTFGDGLQLYSDYRDLLADSTVEAVMLALPNALHAEAIEASVEAQKHLFFEPPVALDRHTGDRVLERIAQSERIVQADLELRYLPVLDAVVGLLDRIGSPRMTKIRLWCDWGYGGGEWFDDVQDQSFFLWLGCWYLDVLDRLFGMAPDGAQVAGGYGANGRLMDHGWAVMKYPRGNLGQFEFNLLATQGQEVRLTIAGTRGEVEADLQSGMYRWRQEGGTWQEEVAQSSQPVHGFVGMRESIADFFGAIAEGREVRAAVEVCRRVHQAALQCASAERRQGQDTDAV